MIPPMGVGGATPMAPPYPFGPQATPRRPTETPGGLHCGYPLARGQTCRHKGKLWFS
jgi:hypothetical protein